MPKEPRTQGGTAAGDAPYRNTRSRSHSVDPQPQPEPKSQFPGRREDQGSRGKGKIKEKDLVSIEEDIHVEEPQREGHAEKDVRPVVRETFEEEMVVEGLLEASVEDEHEEEDEDIMQELPRFQEIHIEGEPSDSDDAETHASLVRGIVREGSADEGDVSGESESRPDQDRDQGEGDEDSDDDDADRIGRMASGALHATPLPSRITRSMAATQTRQISPRQTRSGNQARAAPRPTAFPSPGTQARAVVDRFQDEERRIPYAPPPGTRAAKAMERKGRRG